ncbi:unnamed protein product [Chilo suppressalis]|uniref:C2H2-type domain-containing protein n=1 Tax=Chilo suppressalis TaxID=168631 RepID=A0ABN8LG15_CHISP|nr:unnamed protein product [Chilo suppressalis]
MIEPLPMSFFKISEALQPQNAQSGKTKEPATRTMCVECNEDITTSNGSANKDRAIHYMKYTISFHSCPVCLLTMPTICALKSHLRVHLKNPPYYCPECGNQLPNKIENYPFNHGCEGFNMMRATVRLECSVPKCQSSLFHPHDYKKHLRTNHMKKVFKCPHCVVACFSEATISKHLEIHQPQQTTNINNILLFYQCDMCPGRLVLQSHLESHITTHINTNVYPCWTCGTRYKSIPLLVEHHINQHVTSNNAMADKLKKALKTSIVKCKNNAKSIAPNIFRVVKRCDLCLRSFTYKCNFEDIGILPNSCPYKCSSSSQSLLKRAHKKMSTNIMCPLCQERINENWQDVKTHFALYHKNHKCLDGKVSLLKIDIKIKKKRNRKRKNITATKNRRIRKRNKINHDEPKKGITKNENNKDSVGAVNSDLICIKCQCKCKSKEDLEGHIKSHRDPCMAYQCLECCECFVVKPSFTTHLLLKHGITDVDDYIEKKQCYNNDALNIQQDPNCDMPVEENQCRICRERHRHSNTCPIDY